MTKYPKVQDPALIGEYPAAVRAGGGYVWDEVLEYRVWCHPHDGAPDTEEGNDYYYVFESFEEAQAYANAHPGCEEPLALILQKEYIEEIAPGKYKHVKKERLTEWPVEFLSRPRRTASTIPDFMAPNAPSNRLDIIRGLV